MVISDTRGAQREYKIEMDMSGIPYNKTESVKPEEKETEEDKEKEELITLGVFTQLGVYKSKINRSDLKYSPACVANTVKKRTSPIICF